MILYVHVFSSSDLLCNWRQWQNARHVPDRIHTSCRIFVFSFCSLGHGIQLWDCSLCRLLSGMALPLDSGNCQSAFAWSWASPTLGKQRSEWLEKGTVGTKGSYLHARQVPKEAVTWIDLGCWFDCMHLLLLMHQHMRQHVHICMYIYNYICIHICIYICIWARWCFAFRIQIISDPHAVITCPHRGHKALPYHGSGEAWRGICSGARTLILLGWCCCDWH